MPLTTSLFIYGTLISQEVYQLVTGRDRTGIEAVVHGYSVRRLPGAVYPVMIESPGESAVGLILPNLTQNELNRLDAYEDSFYERLIVTAQITNGQKTDAWAYILPQNHNIKPSQEIWTYDEFAANHLKDFLLRLESFGWDE